MGDVGDLLLVSGPDMGTPFDLRATIVLKLNTGTGSGVCVKINDM